MFVWAAIPEFRHYKDRKGKYNMRLYPRGEDLLEKNKQLFWICS